MLSRGLSSKEPAPLTNGVDKNEEEPTPKQTKLCHGKYVLVAGFDEPYKPVEADLKLLEDIGCRLGLLLKNSEPHSFWHGRPVYQAGNTMTRSMLVTFLKSLSLGEMVLSKQTSVGEALKVFEYEGIILSGALPSVVSMPSSGVGFQKRDQSVTSSISSLCEKIADSIVQWPRLEHVLTTIVSEGNRHFEHCVTSDFTATATRAWIRFSERPKTIVNDGDTILAIATANPGWLTNGLVYLGIIHYRISLEDPAFRRLRTDQSFKRICKQVESDSLGHFFGVRMDSCTIMRDDVAQSEHAYGLAFAREMRNVAINHTSLATPTTPLHYARTAVKFVDYTMQKSPPCARLFSGLCSDESGETPERLALKKALRTRGINIVRWSDNRDPKVRPLVFPPSWKDNNAASHGPSVLLSFEDII